MRSADMGTGHLFTRRELYERVWAEPISALAKTLQVSDVWLAKTCRLSNIPLPPRGYWARLYAGKIVGKTPLPLRAPGESDQVAARLRNLMLWFCNCGTG